jgi:hypothetical protein
MRFFILMILCGGAWFALHGGNGLRRKAERPPTIPPPKVEIDVAAQMLSNYSPDERRQLEEIGLTKGSITAEVFQPITSLSQPLAQRGEEFTTVAGTYVNKMKLYVAASMHAVERGSRLFLFATLVIFVLLHLFGSWRMFRSLADILFICSNVFLVFVSILAPALAFGYGVNPWRYGHYVLFWLPAGVLGISAFAFRVLDTNTPVWRKLYEGLIFPLFSGMVILAKGFMGW